MRIGIDIDGVLIDLETYQFEQGKKYFGKEIVNSECYDIYKIFDVNIKKDIKFWQDHILDYCKGEHTRDDAANIIRKLKAEGHEIFIVTARGSDIAIYDMEKTEMYEIVIKWLKQNEIYYDEIVFTGKTKRKECRKHKIDILIEDKPKNIKQVSKDIPVIVFDSSYNEAITGENVLHAWSWKEIPSLIKFKEKKEEQKNEKKNKLNINF